MRVLLTGGGGNLGRSVASVLLQDGHQVRVLERTWPLEEKRAASWRRQVEVVAGDVTHQDEVVRALANQDVVLHYAGVLPPATEAWPAKAEQVNVGGTLMMLKAAMSQQKPPKFVFASSHTVYGLCQHLPPPRSANDQAEGADHFSRQKAECERLVRESGLTWLIFRIGAAPPSRLSALDPRLLRYLFAYEPNARLEFVHPLDVARAQARALWTPRAWNRVLCIGGGPRCWLTQRIFVERLCAALGLGSVPETAFGFLPACGDWMDTRESQALLKYQSRTFDDYLRELESASPLRRTSRRLARPLLHRWALLQSPRHHRSSIF